MKPFKNINGYTIVELMVAILVGTLLIAAASATYIAQNRSYTTQESVTEINTQSKIAHDMISNDIKSAGFGVSDDIASDPVNNYRNIITPVDSDASPDAITIVGGFRRIGTLWPAGQSPASNLPCPPGGPTEIKMGTTQVSIILSGTVGANTADRRYLSFDGVDYAEVQSCTLSGENCGSGTITLDRPLTATYPLLDTNGDNNCDTGRPVYLVEDITYCVDNNLTLHRIRRNPNAPATCTGIVTSDDEAIAENIEDLQFVYARDSIDNDGMIDTGFENAPAISSTDFNSEIQSVRVNILAKADREDENYAGQGIPPSSIENRIHSQTSDDLKRRRWWQKTVTIRNRWGR